MPNFQAQKTKGRVSNSRYHSYLFSRNGILYFRITVPNRLQSLLKKKEIRKSLNTAKLKEARPAALRLAVLAMQYFTLLDKIRADVVRFGCKNSMQLANINGKFYDFTDTFWLDAEKSEENITELLKVFLKPLKTNKEQKPNSYAENMQSEKEKVVYLAETIEKNTQNCTSRELGYPPAPAQSIVSKNQEMPANQPKKLSDYKTQSVKVLAKKNELYHPKESKPYQSVSFYPVVNQGITEQTPPRMYQQFYQYTGPTLEEAYQAFVEAKKLIWTPASTKDIPPMVKQFVEIVRELEHGNDIYLADLSRDHIRNYFEILKNLPNRINKNVYQKKTWHELAEIGKNSSNERLLSHKTLEGRQINIRSFINWCELEYKGIIQARYVNSGFPKVVHDKRVLRKGNKRIGFTDEELQKLFGNQSHYVEACEGSSAKYWTPLIALYTGMRVEEICQLYIGDIIQIDGVWCFSVNENTDNKEHFKHVKSLAGIRNIPIHPYLWDDIGFKNFVENRRSQIAEEQYQKILLFPDMQERLKIINGSTSKLSSSVVPWFTRYRRSVGVGALEGDISSKTFHSFRHTVVEYLHKVARVDISMIQAVIGHEKNTLGITDNYAGDWSVKTLLDEVILKLPWRF